MKRLRVILLYLLLGAIVNVAVAWGWSAWLIMPTTWGNRAWVNLPGLERDMGWNIYRVDAFGSTQLFALVRISRRGKHAELDYAELDEVLPAWSDLPSLMDEAAQEARRESIKPENVNVIGPIAPSVLMQKAYGFPFRSMYWNWDSGIHKANPEPRNPISIGINLKARSSNPSITDQRALPLGIIPFGFSLNTVITASLLWLLIPGTFVLRRLIRHKRGLCVKCAYDLRRVEHEACPECGEQVAHPSPN